MVKKRLKNNNALTLIDLVIAVTILTLFVGLIGELFHSIFYNNVLIRYNTIATYYAVKIAEYTDFISYDKVQNLDNDELKVALKTQYGDSFTEWPDRFDISMKVENYNGGDASKIGIIKIVKIEAKYKVNKTDEAFVIKKIKVKED